MPRPHTGYLFLRPGSANFWIKLQYPAELGRKRVQKSLGTSDRREAEALALPMIAEHRRLLLDHANRKKGLFRVAHMDYHYPLGHSELPDGTKVFAKHDWATLERDGQTWDEENFLENRIELRTLTPTEIDDPYALLVPKPTPKMAVDNDIEHVERWIKHKGVSEYLQREARESYRLFKELTGGKRFKDASRDDGRKLVEHLFSNGGPNGKGNKSATVQKKVGHLCAAVNLAISEGHLKFNPFSSIIPKVKDATKRLPVSDGDMAVIREDLRTLKPEERLLFVLCATTGMRRGEAYLIREEREVDGLRCVTVGTKTEQSEREIPLPAAALPFLPSKIRGPLFTKDLKNLGRETLRSIRRLGIENPEACIHGLRHRAADRLRNSRVDGQRCPDSMRHAILGHEERTVSDNYGKGYAMWEIKPWIEQIGL